MYIIVLNLRKYIYYKKCLILIKMNVAEELHLYNNKKENVKIKCTNQKNTALYGGWGWGEFDVEGLR